MYYPTGTKHISENCFILAFLSTNKGLEDQKLDCGILEDTVLPSLHSKLGCFNHPNLYEFVCLFLSINGLYKTSNVGRCSANYISSKNRLC